MGRLEMPSTSTLDPPIRLRVFVSGAFTAVATAARTRTSTALCSALSPLRSVPSSASASRRGRESRVSTSGRSCCVLVPEHRGQSATLPFKAIEDRRGKQVEQFVRQAGDARGDGPSRCYRHEVITGAEAERGAGVGEREANETRNPWVRGYGGPAWDDDLDRKS